MPNKKQDQEDYWQIWGANAGFVEELFRQYLQDESAVSDNWRSFFEGLPRDLLNGESEKEREPAKDESDKKATKDTDDNSSHSSDTVEPIRGVAARILENMERSLTIPTATSQRMVPVKVLEENRKIINQFLAASSGDKLSFTHIIAWAIVQALEKYPGLNTAFQQSGDEPQRIARGRVNLGLAVDMQRKDGSRSLIVPNIKNAHEMDFREFVAQYDSMIDKVRGGSIEPSDFQGTTITLTNPGTVGTNTSLPRLMTGQGAIIATGAINFPAEYHATSPQVLSTLGISKVMFVTCTYDHRIIQGAESGQFLGRIHELLLGQDDFYEELFEDLKIPYKPFGWAQDTNPTQLGEIQNLEFVEKQARVLQLINLYRVRGHLIARLDPLSDEANYHPELDPANYGLTLWDLDRKFITGGLGGIEQATLREILDILKETYCDKIGVEYMHIQHPEEKAWLQKQMEPTRNRAQLKEEQRKRILIDLMAAEGFERFMHTKFIGHKRFSLEGAEVIIPLLGSLLDYAGKKEVEEVVIGMAHRGRLNVLANIIKKPYEKIFSEFQENFDPQSVHGTGDVKYHVGAAGVYETVSGKKIHVSVAPNPSHLEAVNPVVEGVVRAKQDRCEDLERARIVPLLIHGDAAFAGQGVVAETFNLSQLKGYRTGGTFHVIINNQIGFTTRPTEGRSSPYASDVAKMVQAPIFHVNGDDPEAVIRVAKLAVEYRHRYKKDVVMDVLCYRRHGHNEGDEPSYTQPLMYKKIDERPSAREIYQEKLAREGIIDEKKATARYDEVKRCLDLSYEETEKQVFKFERDVPLAVSSEEVEKLQPLGSTAVDEDLLEDITKAITSIPRTFKIHPKLKPQLERRRKMFEENKIDWAAAESLAFGASLCDGTPVRLSGQDSRRGTFSQRHLVFTDLNSGEEYFGLNNIIADQAAIQAFDSLLSEEAALGFEFGYSVADPLALVLWEAQFGDFANGAQVIIDNFIASSDAKWQQPCDLVMLLPHGYEGQGPEHSSARLERFLQLCAENNLQVCNCTTPAQYFHVLRRQMRDAVRKPLILMTPKSLLRHSKVISSVSDLTDGSFNEVLDEIELEDKKNVRRVVLCSGKVYYDLLKYREKNEIDDVALVRLEQLYPYPKDVLTETLGKYAKAEEVVWAQEEPENMGAWRFLCHRLEACLVVGQHLSYVGRPERASTANGIAKVHQEDQKRLVEQAFTRAAT